jgi:hypothetical protein
MSLPNTNSAITTAGNGTLPAAALVGHLITRSGPAGAFTDTTDTAANIIAALTGLSNVPGGISWTCEYINTTGFVATLAGGTGVTVSANTGASLAIPANSVAALLITTVAGGTVTVSVLYRFGTD